jgi:uncharacterized membrane protein
MPQTDAKRDVTATTKLLVLLLAFAWGFNWIAAAVALREVSPWSLRFAGAGIGAGTLFAAAILTGHNLRVPRGEHLHVMVAGFFNVAAFQILSGFAQLSGATSRAIVITYSMPIWATLLGWILLDERLNKIGTLAFALCVAGLTVLVWPLFADGFPPFVVYSLGCALSWAFATVYMKWVKATIEPLANAAWQLLFGFLFIAAGTFVFEGAPRLWPRAFPVVVNRRAAADHHGLARLAAGAGDRRHRFDRVARRAADRARHRRLRADLRGGGLRAAAAEREAYGDARVSDSGVRKVPNIFLDKS